MKKKFTGILLCLLLSVAFILTGCDLFPRNLEQYLNKPVCTITYADGKKEEISTEAFINAFNSYGASLTQQGSTYEQAAEQTVEVLISRYVLLNHAKQVVEISPEDQKEIWDDVYTSLKSNLDSYVTEVRKDWNIDEPSVQTSEEDVVKYTAYEKIAEVVEVNGEYKIKLLETDDVQSTNFTSLENVIQAFKNYANPTDTTNNARIKKEAYRRFVTALKKNEEGLDLSKDSDSVVKRYAEKLEKSIEENYYITNLEEYYKTVDDYSTITVQQVLKKYKTLMLQSKYKYEANNETYDKAMLESFKDVNYVVDDNYFFVSHILVKFSDAQSNEYKNLETDAYISRDVYNQRMANLAQQVVAKVRDEDGKVTDDTSVKASDILNSLKTDLSYANSDEEKAEIFKNYMYKYGEDPGVQNAEYMYVIGNETSQMVESFTNASRELNKNGEFGAVSDLVISEHGVHIIFYGGKVQNLFEINNINNFNLDVEDIEKLTSTKLSPLNNKTVFDKVFEMLSDDNYSIFENMNLNVLKKDIKIEKHTNVYKNL